MAGTLQAIANLVRGLATLGVVGVVIVGGWIGYQAYNAKTLLEDKIKLQQDELAKRDETIGKLNDEVKQQAEQIRQLDMAVRLLKIDHRLAEVRVLDQTTDNGKTTTRLSFTEVDDEGHPLDTPREFSIEGDVVYIDAFVVKYQDELIERGDPLRSTSICLFRRLFGETQKPVEGFQLDRVGAQPLVYNRGEQVTEEERQIWSRFWEYANNPRLAEQAGVRAAHGEAPSIKLRPGKLYRVELRASGGLTIKTEELPSNEPTL